VGVLCDLKDPCGLEDLYDQEDLYGQGDLCGQMNPYDQVDLCYGWVVLGDLEVLLSGDQVVVHDDQVVEAHSCNPQEALLEVLSRAFLYVEVAHPLELSPGLVEGEPCECQGVPVGSHKRAEQTEQGSVLEGRCLEGKSRGQQLLVEDHLQVQCSLGNRDRWPRVVEGDMRLLLAD